MGRTRKVGTTGRFGVRYGKTIRVQISEVEKKYKYKKLKCPRCTKFGVKRVAAGIWECRKCSAKFAGKAYEI